MTNLKTQIGDSLAADFSEKTWTFEMPDKFTMSAGSFAIIPEDQYNDLITALTRCARSMQAHPECTVDSEFNDFVISAWDAIEAVSQTNNGEGNK